MISILLVRSKVPGMYKLDTTACHCSKFHKSCFLFSSNKTFLIEIFEARLIRWHIPSLLCLSRVSAAPSKRCAARIYMNSTKHQEALQTFLLLQPKQNFNFNSEPVIRSHLLSVFGPRWVPAALSKTCTALVNLIKHQVTAQSSTHQPSCVTV